jgi:IS30 family transposase
MVGQRRRGLSAGQRGELWKRWKDGQSLSEIGRALNKQAASIHGFLAARGGIPPAPRRRSDRALSVREREEISRQVCAGSSVRSVAARLGRAPSTISREINRNGGRDRYRAGAADARAWVAARRPKVCKLGRERRLQQLVANKLRLDWSPEQIAGWLDRSFPLDDSMRVSHETIYRSLFIQARGVLERELLRHLRSRRLIRRARTSTTAEQSRGRIVDAISIRERPADVADRAIPGHWEGDLISGSKNSHIATLVERQTRFTKLVRVEGKDATSVAAALSRQVRTLPAELRRTLTWDRGSEMAQHKKFTIATNVKVYFCDPKSPWQRGTNENTNRLLRQYFPDGTDLSAYSQSDLNDVALRLNGRPRKILGFLSPAEKLQSVLP